MHEDLFQQAAELATIDAKKPKQANLRRAVSAAYYAVFHYCGVRIRALLNNPFEISLRGICSACLMNSSAIRY